MWRFFAALSMTNLDGHIVKCTNVLHSSLVEECSEEVIYGG